MTDLYETFSYATRCARLGLAWLDRLIETRDLGFGTNIISTVQFQWGFVEVGHKQVGFGFGIFLVEGFMA